MAKNKGLAGLDSLKAIVDKPHKQNKVVIAGAESAKKASKATQSKKTKTLAIRLNESDRAITKDLALKFLDRGLQYSEANAVRAAIRNFKPTEKILDAIAEEIKSEDGRGMK